MSEESQGVDTIVKSCWNGYLRYDFSVEGHGGLVIVPDKTAQGNPWVWRAEFFDAFAQADMALLKQGWHLAYYSIKDMYGSPQAVELMHAFQDRVESDFGLSEKTVIFGFSRGGLYAFNYAAKYPERVAALYLDAPVLDIRSWPGGFGTSERAEKEWAECLNAYGLTEKSALAFYDNPLDKTNFVIKAKIPIIVVVGDADINAPIAENTLILAERCCDMGEDFKLIVKPGVAHHPHSLDNPAPIVAFLIEKFYSTNKDGYGFS